MACGTCLGHWEGGRIPENALTTFSATSFRRKWKVDSALTELGPLPVFDQTAGSVILTFVLLTLAGGICSFQCECAVRTEGATTLGGKWEVSGALADLPLEPCPVLLSDCVVFPAGLLPWLSHMMVALNRKEGS